jgi:hypothetical protein
MFRTTHTQGFTKFTPKAFRPATTLPRPTQRREPAAPAKKKAVYGLVSEVTVSGLALAVLAPVAALVGLCFGMPPVVLAAGGTASLFGAGVCLLERRAATCR